MASSRFASRSYSFLDHSSSWHPLGDCRRASVYQMESSSLGEALYIALSLCVCVCVCVCAVSEVRWHQDRVCVLLCCPGTRHKAVCGVGG